MTRTQRRNRAVDKLLTVERDTNQQAVALFTALMGAETDQIDVVVGQHVGDRTDTVPILLYSMGYLIALAKNLRDSSPAAAETCRALIECDQFESLTTDLG